MGTRVVDRVNIGKLVEGRISPGVPKLGGLEGDESSESNEYKLSKFENDDLDEGLEFSTNSTLTY
jgi:hypothetical protein